MLKINFMHFNLTNLNMHDTIKVSIFMGGMKEMGNVKETLVKWLEDNPEGWKNTDAFIHKQTDVSTGSVNRYVPEIIAKRDGIMPSEVQELRQKEGGIPSRRPKADPNKIRQIIAAHPNAPVRDLAFLADCSHGAIERVLKEIGRESEGEPEDDPDEIREIKSQMEQLQARLNRLSKG